MMSFFMTIIGVVLIVEGIPWFLSPGKTKNLLAQIHSLPNTTLRFMGLSVMLVGLLIVRLSTS